MPVRVTVWGENVHEHTNEIVGKLYPDGMHACIAAGLNEDPEIQAGSCVLQDPEHGLTAERLAQTDVLIWWGHCAHGEVADEIVDRVQERVLQGMGLLVLHSGHYAKIFKRLMGTTCSLTWREAGEMERLWVTNPGHPIVQGIDKYIELPHTEMYGEPFAVPNPDEVIFISNFAGGEVFRSGLVYRRGNGKIFYFRPGHETYPIYYDANIKRVLKNAVKWAQPEGSSWIDDCPEIPVEKAPNKIVSQGEGLHKPGEGGFK
ncbi:trehalose utilization protein ThuA [Alginatibacterium sediminis]|uniref:Trehalose utilization protein ThuA n=1 Tax=Alginatibacterium sediminis TaxID=2164068 RepID=A0A420E9U8_9ALTE|nr:ThuA domain-containing protein [Alginatibacterium sediminis]RKF17453.1 trehalose utilization protein ThuA [Alginatibacterium sediminis]